LQDCFEALRSLHYLFSNSCWKYFSFNVCCAMFWLRLALFK